MENCRVYRSAEFFATYHSLVDAILTLDLNSRKISRCDHNVFHLEKLKDLTYVHEYAVTVSNWFEALDALEDPVELWDTFKHETLEIARRCVGGRPRSQDGFASAEGLESIEKRRAASLAGNQNQHRALSHRIRAPLRKDK